MAKRRSAATAEFDEMGQPIGATKGEPDQSALALVDEANSDLEPLVDVEEQVEPQSKPSGLIEQLIAEAKADPSVAVGLADLLASNEQTRDLFGLGPGKGPAIGNYDRDYTQEPALRVYGGVEVAHPKGFRPLPASWLLMYKGANGDTNNKAEALRDSDGRLLLSENYKKFLDGHKIGQKMDGNVRFDIAADQVMPEDEGVAIA